MALQYVIPVDSRHSHHLHQSNGPGKWLLDPLVQGKIDTDTLVLHFKMTYDGG